MNDPETGSTRSDPGKGCLRSSGLALLFCLLHLASSCNNGGSKQPAGSANPPGLQETFRITIEDDPFRMLLSDDPDIPFFFQKTSPDGKGSMVVVLPDGDTVTSTTLVEEAREVDRWTFRVATDREGWFLVVRLENDRAGGLKVCVEPEGPLNSELKMGERLFSARSEHLHGLTERVVDGGDELGFIPCIPSRLDRRGDVVQMYVRPTVSLYTPFYLSSAGYGLYVESTWPGTFDMASSDPETVSFRFEGGRLCYHVFQGGFPEILDRYTRLTGRPFLPPKWAFGVWRWRDEHENLPNLYDGTPNPSPYNSQVYEDIAMFEELGIPVQVYWLDRPWALGGFGFDDFTPDPDRFPEFEDMAAWLRGRGVHLLLWTAPWAYGDMRQEARDLGYLAPGSDKVMDFTNPDAVEWWKGKYAHLLDMGVEGFKLDRGEEVVPSGSDQIYQDGRSGREIHNDYPRLYAKAFHQGLSSRLDEFIVLPRAGFAGSQKHAIFWGGDTAAYFWGLRSVIISAQRAGLMGMPIWGSDTGGYGWEPHREDFAHWLEVSCFHPIMEVGGAGSHAPWDMPLPPFYDGELIKIYRFYAHLHTALMDYSYSLAQEAHETGMPMVRPLFLLFPDDEEAWERWDEFFYGDEILVAPVWQPNVRSREVYLPEGQWKSYWEGTLHEGPAVVRVSAPLRRIPLFTPEGSTVLPAPEEVDPSFPVH